MCVPVVRRHYWRALVNSSPGSNYKWAVCICMTPGIWMPLNQSHIGYSGCWLSVLLLPFASLNHLTSPFACSHCHVSFLPPLSVNSTDSEFLKTAKCFYIKGSFASHSWCGGGPAYSHRRRGRDWCWRVTTVRLNSTLVPLGGTCIMGRNFTSNNLPLLKFNILKKYTLSGKNIHSLY